MVPQGSRTVTGPRPRALAGKEGNRLGKKERKRSETKRKGGGEKMGARKEGRQERQGEMAGGGKRCTLRGWGAAVAALLECPPPTRRHYLPAPLAGDAAASEGSRILGITLTTILQGRKEGLSRPRKMFQCTPLSSDGVRIQTLLLHAASGRI